jgi:hypothetical protein
MRPPLVFLLCLAASLAPDAAAGDWGLDALMRALAQGKSGRATFTEKKFIALLDRPVESSGELVYAAPDHLEKNTFKPVPEFLVLDRGTLNIEREGRKHTLRLDDYPEVAAFIDSIRGTLAGDRPALERVYRLFLGGSAAHWTLVLLPLAPEMAASVRRIDIAGAAGQVRSIAITQADGDRSVMAIEPAGPPP